MRIPPQHLHRLVPTDRRDLLIRKPGLYQPADGFLAKVLKAEVIETATSVTVRVAVINGLHCSLGLNSAGYADKVQRPKASDDAPDRRGIAPFEALSHPRRIGAAPRAVPGHSGYRASSGYRHC